MPKQIPRRRREEWRKELFPGDDRMFDTYGHLSARELAIVACAVLDAALAELIEKRLVKNEDKAVPFLGLDNSDGPISTFAAKITLAYLLGILDDNQCEIYHILKQIRNEFAHNVNVSFGSRQVQRHMARLNKIQFSTWPEREREPLLKNEAFCQDSCLIVFCQQQVVLHNLIANIDHLTFIGKSAP